MLDFLREEITSAESDGLPLTAANLKKVVKKLEVLENGCRQARACLRSLIPEKGPMARQMAKMIVELDQALEEVE